MSGDQDLLERAARALREAMPPSPDELALARARLLAAHGAARKGQRGRTLRWVLPLAAVLAAGTALAATPEAFERVARAVSSLFTPPAVRVGAKKKRAPKTSQAEQTSVKAAAAPTVAPTPEPVQPLQPTPPAEAAWAAHDEDARAPRARAPSARPAHASRRAQRSVSAAQDQGSAEPVAASKSVEPAPAPAVAPDPAPDLDLALYRVAHNAHFRARDFVRALRGWDAYLEAYPRGTFAVEARYNRAICLVRLDQKAEARRALRPFANGEVARGYRQAEAKKLLEALE